MATAGRKVRLESFLRREVALCITNELRDPRLGFTTITRVELSGDLQVATAYYRVLGGADERRQAAKALKAARGHVQASAAGDLHLRNVPHLRFRYDDRADRQAAMERLIDEARASDPDHGLGSSADPDADAGCQDAR